MLILVLTYPDKQAVAFLVLWPMPMYGSGYIFSKQFFTGWVTIAIIWIFCSLGAVGVFPIYEGRMTLFRTFKFMYLDITGKWHPRSTIQAQEVAGGKATPGDQTPREKAAPKEDIAA